MTTTTAVTVLRGSGVADLLAAPSVLLRYQPSEALVVVGVDETRVQFCLSVPLQELPDAYDDIGFRATSAAANFPGCQLVLIGYSRRPIGVARTLRRLAVVWPGVCQVFVTDHKRYWCATDAQPRREDGVPVDLQSSSLSVQAVFQGINVAPSREVLLAEVAPPPGVEVPGLCAELDDTHEVLRDLSGCQLLAHLEDLVGLEVELRRSEALELVAILTEDQALAELLGILNTRTARVVRRRLAEARRLCPPEAEPNLLAGLAVACWLDCEGALMNACLEQLADVAPEHPVVGMLLRLQELAIPPSHWDEA